MGNTQGRSRFEKSCGSCAYAGDCRFRQRHSSCRYWFNPVGLAKLTMVHASVYTVSWPKQYSARIVHLALSYRSSSSRYQQSMCNTIEALWNQLEWTQCSHVTINLDCFVAAESCLSWSDVTGTKDYYLHCRCICICICCAPQKLSRIIERDGSAFTTINCSHCRRKRVLSQEWGRVFESSTHTMCASPWIQQRHDANYDTIHDETVCHGSLCAALPIWRRTLQMHRYFNQDCSTWMSHSAVLIVRLCYMKSQYTAPLILNCRYTM